MTSGERVLNCCGRKGFDRIPVRHEGAPEVNSEIRDYFGLANDNQLMTVLGDDFRYVEPRYVGPELKTYPDGSVEGYFGERYKYAEFEGGKYLESVYQPFKGITELKDLDRSHFPTADYFDYSTIQKEAYDISGKRDSPSARVRPGIWILSTGFPEHEVWNRSLWT